MRLEFDCADGSHTVASTASIGLFFWYAHQLPNPIPIPSPYNKDFLPLVFAAIERKFGVQPATDIVPPPANAENISSFKEVARMRDSGELSVIRYEACCLYLLHWLKEQGDIVSFQIHSKSTVAV